MTNDTEKAKAFSANCAPVFTGKVELNDQVQRVVISSAKSSWRPVTSTILQRSTLLEQRGWTK